MHRKTARKKCLPTTESDRCETFRKLYAQSSVVLPGRLVVHALIGTCRPTKSFRKSRFACLSRISSRMLLLEIERTLCFEESKVCSSKPGSRTKTQRSCCPGFLPSGCNLWHKPLGGYDPFRRVSPTLVCCWKHNSNASTKSNVLYTNLNSWLINEEIKSSRSLTAPLAWKQRDQTIPIVLQTSGYKFVIPRLQI